MLCKYAIWPKLVVSNCIFPGDSHPSPFIILGEFEAIYETFAEIVFNRLPDYAQNESGENVLFPTVHSPGAPNTSTF